MIIDTVLSIIIFIAFIGFALKRLMNYLHALQQDDYDNGRLTTWIIRNKVYDTRVSAFLLLVGIIGFVPVVPSIAVGALLFFGFALAALIEKDPRKESKKSLVLTKRARRILGFSMLYAILFGLGGALSPFPITWILAVHALPLALILGNASLMPYESSVQKRLMREAQVKLNDINPTVIAITGSYGKTSVKHILGHILKMSAPSIMTPGSVNTLMGITRIIREQLEPQHKYFIVEMGAYGPGSIAALCQLTPPHYGIISSIGHAHYERFKTLDTVVQAKYELAESVLARSGTMIVHEKTLMYAHSQNIRNRAMDQFIVCGEPMQTNQPKNVQEFSYLAPDDLRIILVEQTPKGLCVRVSWKGESYVLRAPLFGIHHGHNIALAFACAMSLGMEEKDIKTALARMPQIKHRLEVKTQVDGSTIIDDAFNSNPPGFRSALHVLDVLAKDQKDTKGQGRAILVTPGMVELGNAHDEVHKTIGGLAAQVCDIAVVVHPQRIPTFLEGLRAGNGKAMIMEFDTFVQAQEWLMSNKQAGDVILLENDLPDIYERVLKI